MIGANLNRLEALYKKYGLDDKKFSLDDRKFVLDDGKFVLDDRKNPLNDEISPINPRSESDLHKALVVDKNIHIVEVIEVLDASAPVNIQPATTVSPIDSS